MLSYKINLAIVIINHAIVNHAIVIINHAISNNKLCYF